MKKRQVYLSTVFWLSVLCIILLFVISRMSNNYNELLDTKMKTDDLFIEQLDKNELLNRENIELEQKLQMVELPTYKYTEEEVILLAKCVQAEAGDYAKHKNSQKYITQVILNRIESDKYPNNIRDVIYDKKHGVQFSVAYNGMIDKVELESETLANVYSVLVHGTDLPSYVLYFYSARVKENWVNTLNIYKTLEGTVFAYENKEE